MTTATKANWIKSEDAGYTSGKLLLDLPGGGHASVYKVGRKWVCAIIYNNVAASSRTFPTKIDAITFAESKLA